MFKYFLFICLFVIFKNPLYSNDSLLIAGIDSLISKADSYQRGNPDSALPLYQEAINLASTSITKTSGLEQENIITEKWASALVGAGTEYFNMGNYSEALRNFQLSFNLYLKTGNNDRLAAIHICLGRTYRCYGPEMFYKAMKEMKMADSLFAKSGNIRGVSVALRELGWVFGDNINEETYNLDSALYFLNKAWLLMKDSGNEPELAKINTGIAWMLNKMGRYDEALIKAKEVLKYYEKIQSTTGLYNIHYTLGDLYSLKGNHKQALQHLNNALMYARQGGNVDMENNILESISNNYLELKDYKNAYDYYHQSVDKKFEMLSSEKIAAIEEMKTKFETEKKEFEILNLSEQKKLQSKIIVLLTLGIILTIIVLIIALSFYRAKRSANRLLLVQNAEISQQKEEITTQRDEIEAQRDIVVSQKQQIELIHDELTSSIDYARQIQSTLLPPPALLQELFHEHFVLFNPRNIVSGDFYWAKRINHQLVFCVADCTGHGVPGSLMSMLGISFLNEIVRNMEILKADQILNLLRDNVVSALQQKGIRGEHKDGMDIALCVMDSTTLKLQFAGAMNPCWIVKNHSQPEKEMLILEPNLMPVAIHHLMEPFNQQEVQLNKGDLIYLFSDGYADQTGGEKNKKLQTRQLQEFLLANCHLELSYQKQILEDYFEQWKGNNAQVDDVTILSVKI